MFKTVKTSVERFDEAVSCTSQRIRKTLSGLSDEIKADTSEIRIRCGRHIMLSGMYGNVFVCHNSKISYIPDNSAFRVSVNDIEQCFHSLCGYSVHTHQNGICKGFVTVKGGHRAGIAGTAVCNNGNINSIRDISSINIRISREFIGCAENLFNIIKDKNEKSLIIAGPPSSGKTTVIRDLARLISSEEGGFIKTVIIDERDEIAACCNGVVGNNVGISSDILTGYPKKEAVQIAVRSMSPEIIIIDEIGTVEEVCAIEEGLNTGVSFILTVHASCINDLVNRPQTQRLIKTNAFSTAVFLGDRATPSRITETYTISDFLR